ncbi:MAG TPA: hypothetical protein VHT91_16190 [Kofleriaceae bacterium]|nr:hypothetical protein [Kofleriaceae bacterium]
MRNAAILMLIVTGCAVDGDPDTSMSESNLNCGSFCDPGDPMDVNAALDAVTRYGGWAFPGSTLVAPPTCANLGSDQAPDYECIEQRSASANPCGPVVLSCYRSKCHYQLIDDCH